MGYSPYQLVSSPDFFPRMLDFDTLCGRKTPSVAAVINPTGEATFAKFLFGSSNVLIPVAWSPWAWLAWVLGLSFTSGCRCC